MAPEHPPCLVIFNSRIENDLLIGSLEYIEPERADQNIRVRWAVEDQPKDFTAVGGGVAYVYNSGQKIDVISISNDARPTLINDSPLRYQWTEGLQHGQPSLMFVLIIPEGYGMDNPYPNPAGTKIFKERLALYWILKGDDIGRTKVEWELKQLEQDLQAELLRINKAYLSSDAVVPSKIAVDDALKPKPLIAQNFSGDVYIAGQVGAMGAGAYAHDMIFKQIWDQVSNDIDLPRLAEELQLLREAMKKESNAPEHDAAIGSVANAEQAAKTGKGPEALEYLKAAGKWALDIAEKVGIGVAVVALKNALGL